MLHRPPLGPIGPTHASCRPPSGTGTFPRSPPPLPLPGAGEGAGGEGVAAGGGPGPASARGGGGVRPAAPFSAVPGGAESAGGSAMLGGREGRGGKKCVAPEVTRREIGSGAQREGEEEAVGGWTGSCVQSRDALLGDGVTPSTD